MYRQLRVVMAVLFGIVAVMPALPSGSVSAQEEVLSVGTTAPSSPVNFKHYEEPDFFTYQRVYKKVRCPNCGMESYIKRVQSALELEEERQPKETKKEEDFTKEILAEVFPAEPTAEGEEALKTSETTKGTGRAGAVSPLEMRLQNRERNALKRQVEIEMVGCPYCQFHFHPTYTPDQIRQLFQEDESGLSPLERSYSQAITYEISRDLRQFGYDMFEEAQAQKRTEATTQTDSGDVAEESATLLQSLKNKISIADRDITGGGLDNFSQTQPFTVPVDADYVIGPGDTFIINVWGTTQQSFPVTVDMEGKIILPKAGPVYVWGLRFNEVEDLIIQRLKQYYSNFQVDVSMGKLKQIRVFVLGEVERPGTHMLSSQSTVMHALMTAGGPSKLGSLRKIQLLRSGEVKQVIDLYDILIKGDKAYDLRLMSDDTIFVPPIGDVVAIAGNVKRPGIYETRSEIPLSDLLGFAGGIMPTGSLHRVQVERITDNERRTVLDIDLKGISDIPQFTKTVSLQNGDLVVVEPIHNLRHNFVTVVGNVQAPGDYELKTGMTANDLLTEARGLLPGTHMAHAEIARVNEQGQRRIIPIDLTAVTRGDINQNLMLSEWDIIVVYSEADITPPAFVEIFGAVHFPGTYELSPGIHAKDIIFKAGGIKNTASLDNVEIFHYIPGENPVVYSISLDSETGPELVDGDQVFVREDSARVGRQLITLKGEVRYPGTYAVRKGERLSSIIERAGGFTDNAFLEGAVFTRESIKKAQQNVIKRFVKIQMQSILEEESAARSERASRLNRTGVGGGIPDAATPRKQLLQLLASTEVEGRMVIKLSPDVNMEGTEDDILVEGGDSLYIPQVTPTIQVIGAVNNAMNVLYEEGKGLDYYLEKAGGMTRHADIERTYVIRANGEAQGRFARIAEIHRGDTIVVPHDVRYRIPRDAFMMDVIDVVSRIAIGVAFIAAVD
ncbi:MAG: SLBB domain-containing protein [Candidatus Omnitrophica bacterium]|nr:SLBB domain-containing protein [Candidatus Omnitrophota bacterium]